jgi:CRISPR system Cascade subunit CasB
MSGVQRDPKETAKHLLAYLRGRKNDRGVMADLRCALSPSPAKRARAWPLLAAVAGIGDTRVETVSGLFACHPEETQDGNLGTTCRSLAAESNTFDGRFRRLLACDREEICERLRPVVLAAKAKGIPVNYEELFADLCYWGEKVKERWAQKFWGTVARPEPTAASSSEAES